MNVKSKTVGVFVFYVASQYNPIRAVAAPYFAFASFLQTHIFVVVQDQQDILPRYAALTEPREETIEARTSSHPLWRLFGLNLPTFVTGRFRHDEANDKPNPEKPEPPEGPAGKTPSPRCAHPSANGWPSRIARAAPTPERGGSNRWARPRGGNLRVYEGAIRIAGSGRRLLSCSSE